jgi:hypothetical protein
VGEASHGMFGHGHLEVNQHFGWSGETVGVTHVRVCCNKSSVRPSECGGGADPSSAARTGLTAEWVSRIASNTPSIVNLRSDLSI